MSEQAGGPKGRSIERATSGGSRPRARVGRVAGWVVFFTALWLPPAAYYAAGGDQRPVAVAWSAGVGFGIALRAWWRE